MIAVDCTFSEVVSREDVMKPVQTQREISSRSLTLRSDPETTILY